ncbi:hypothetical protein N7509_012606 [Penicillium cosmopolitanum]|uniref:Uncharacterized protein n=1 Tax=Penicillium cosmopolitanum TaxID=1131564 RepID=A0A9W9SJS7_9EURO|nr:uncharacterized protein N7509_012606 [Penicillium cosmopolitanum]KAJ5379487.1 hypothetical protein N7509_012606 [Penicillium cosmopolitanum]
MDSPSSFRLSPVQKAEMMTCIHTAIEELRMEVIPSKASQKKNARLIPQINVIPPSETATPSVPSTAPIFDIAKANNWVTSEVGYFLPDPTRDEQVRMKEDTIYFSNAHAFVGHIRALSAFKNENTIRLNIHSCLRGEALEWFISELSHYEREKLRSFSLEEGWIETLTRRFKNPPSHALKTLKRSKYNWADVRSQRSLVMWAHNMLRLAQESNEYPVVWHQIHAVWDQIEIPIRGNVSEPSSGTTVASFMEELDRWYNLWR